MTTMDEIHAKFEGYDAEGWPAWSYNGRWFTAVDQRDADHMKSLMTAQRGLGHEPAEYRRRFGPIRAEK